MILIISKLSAKGALISYTSLTNNQKKIKCRLLVPGNLVVLNSEKNRLNRSPNLHVMKISRIRISTARTLLAPMEKIA